jgi:xanthine/uracil permease
MYTDPQVFAMICVCEVFGSPFIRNGSVFLSLLVGYVFAVIVPSAQTGQSFVNQDIIDASPSVTFLWTTTFPLSKTYMMALPLMSSLSSWTWVNSLGLSH